MNVMINDLKINSVACMLCILAYEMVFIGTGPTSPSE